MTESFDPSDRPNADVHDLETRLVALILGEASDFERDQLIELMARQPELAQRYQQLQRSDEVLRDLADQDHAAILEPAAEWRLSTERRSELLKVFGPSEAESSNDSPSIVPRIFSQSNWMSPKGLAALASVSLLLVLGIALTQTHWMGSADMGMIAETPAPDEAFELFDRDFESGVAKLSAGSELIVTDPSDQPVSARDSLDRLSAVISNDGYSSQSSNGVEPGTTVDNRPAGGRDSGISHYYRNDNGAALSGPTAAGAASRSREPNPGLDFGTGDVARSISPQLRRGRGVDFDDSERQAGQNQAVDRRVVSNPTAESSTPQNQPVKSRFNQDQPLPGQSKSGAGYLPPLSQSVPSFANDRSGIEGEERVALDDSAPSVTVRQKADANVETPTADFSDSIGDLDSDSVVQGGRDWFKPPTAPTSGDQQTIERDRFGSAQVDKEFFGRSQPGLLQPGQGQMESGFGGGAGGFGGDLAGAGGRGAGVSIPDGGSLSLGGVIRQSVAATESNGQSGEAPANPGGKNGNGRIAESHGGQNEFFDTQLSEETDGKGNQRREELMDNLYSLDSTEESDILSAQVRSIERKQEESLAELSESLQQADKSLEQLSQRFDESKDLQAAEQDGEQMMGESPSTAPDVTVADDGLRDGAAKKSEKMAKAEAADGAPSGSGPDESVFRLRSEVIDQTSQSALESANRAAGRVVAGLDETIASGEPFSTFSLHVADVSFKLAVDALSQGQWPDSDRIRIEEFVNALDYRDPIAAPSQKVACQIEQVIHPYFQQRNLLRISLGTAATGRASSVPLRLTLLLDNSGSMERVDRRQSVLRAIDSLAAQLGPADQVTLIAFANTPRLVADRVPGSQAGELVQTIVDLTTEGGTNFESALDLAFEKAVEQFQANAQNRIVLFTDGAVNLGDSDPERLAGLVTRMRERGIAFDAAGISARDLNDEVLESLTRQGDGRYYLLDSSESVDEGFAQQIAGALRPAAKNVKVQVVFNPERVGRYKLLGFEKHRLNKDDFRNDQVDAAELAAAEAGVAVYQIEPLPEGQGDIGSVSVRFRDLSSGQMVERRWPIPFDANAPRIDQATATMKLATAASMLAAKLGGTAIGEAVDWESLSRMTADLPEEFQAMARVQQLRQMIQQARQINGQ